MTERNDLLASIVTTTDDYRAGELPTPTAAHVDHWVNQFDVATQLPILREMDHTLRKTYFNKQIVSKFLAGLIKNDKLVGADPSAFWRASNFLNIQGGGSSQHDLINIFDGILGKEIGIRIADCGVGNDTYLYIDDVIFTGGRVKSDLTRWIADAAPQKATLHIIVIAIHEGFYYNRDQIVRAARDADKAIDIKWWRLAMFENRKFSRDSSDILWPVDIPDDPTTQSYVGNMSYAPVFRTAGQTGQLQIFSSDEGRQLLEREFLKAGARIRAMCPNLPEIERPLGHSYLETLGFGSTVVTFRNCPNNTPLAFWVGNPWYPLFARKTNADSRMERMFGGAI